MESIKQKFKAQLGQIEEQYRMRGDKNLSPL